MIKMHSKNRHVPEQIAEVNRSLGGLYQVITNSNNSSCVLVYAGGRDGQAMKVAFNGNTIMEPETPIAIPRIALKPDGTRVAVSNGLQGSSIFLFGPSGLVHTYRLDRNFRIHHLEWLPQGRLVWSGYTEEEATEREHEGESVLETTRTKTTWFRFANGEDVTGQLEFEPIISAHGKSAVLVREDGLRYYVRDDGSKHGFRQDCCERLHCHCHVGQPQKDKPAKAVTSPTSTGLRVEFNGHSGPDFHCIQENGLGVGFRYNDERTRVAYVGVTRTATANTIGWAGKQLFGGMGSKILDNPLTAIPAALLFNPYFGPAYIYFEHLSKRYLVVNHDKVWKRVFKSPPRDLFFTPFDELAAVCQNGTGERLVIDETPGPEFEKILNPRYLESEGRVCYAAVRDNKVYRVTC